MEHLLGLASFRVLNSRFAWFWYSSILLINIFYIRF